MIAASFLLTQNNIISDEVKVLEQVIRDTEQISLEEDVEEGKEGGREGGEGEAEK